MYRLEMRSQSPQNRQQMQGRRRSPEIQIPDGQEPVNALNRVESLVKELLSKQDELISQSKDLVDRVTLIEEKENQDIPASTVQRRGYAGRGISTQAKKLAAHRGNRGVSKWQLANEVADDAEDLKQPKTSLSSKAQHAKAVLQVSMYTIRH